MKVHSVIEFPPHLKILQGDVDKDAEGEVAVSQSRLQEGQLFALLSCSSSR